MAGKTEGKAQERKTGAYKKRQKELIMRALTDPKFRKLLASNPEQALEQRQISVTMRKEIDFILATVKGIEAHISALSDSLLCANGGPCGIA